MLIISFRISHADATQIAIGNVCPQTLEGTIIMQYL